MNLESVKTFIEENQESEEVKAYLDSFKVTEDVSLELFKAKLEVEPEFKSFMDSEKDKYSSKALETWKTNNLEKLISEEIKIRNPEVDTKDLALQELQRKIEIMEQEKVYESLKNIALKTASEKQLPTELVDYFIGDNEETTLENLSKLEEIFNNKLEVCIKDRLKGEGYTPPKSSVSNTITKQQFLGLGIGEQTKFATENPELYQEIMK